MTTKYLGTLICGVAVLLIGAVWTLCVFIERRTTKLPAVPSDYFQRDVFCVLGLLIVSGCAVMGV